MQTLSIFCNSSQYALHPWCKFLLLFGLTNASKCERSLPLRHDWTSAPGKLPFWPERDVIGHNLVSYPTWRRPICELRYYIRVKQTTPQVERHRLGCEQRKVFSKLIPSTPASSSGSSHTATTSTEHVTQVAETINRFEHSHQPQPPWKGGHR